MIDIDAIRRGNPLPAVVGKVVQLLPAGKEWVACCPFHADRSPSFTIFDGGRRFHCFGCGASGDVLDFVQRAYGVPLIEAARLLGAGDILACPQPAPLPAEQADRSGEALAIWNSSIPAAGTLAEAYLAFRGIHPPIPPDIRFQRLPCGNLGPVPCLVAAVRNAVGEIRGVQRIWLAGDGRGKAAVAKPKLSLGRVKGGATRLGDLDGTGAVTVCEGPEDGLSLHAMMGGAVWVAAGATFLPHMQFPAEVRSVTIGADNDAAGEQAARKAAHAFAAQGLAVRIVRPLESYKDFNDELRGHKAMQPRIGPERLANAETIAPADAAQPQPLLREVAPGAPYPVHALGPLRAAVEAVQAWTQAPVAIPAQSALAVAALALQGHANVETLGGPRPLSLYCLTIAASGERKSSCDAPLMRAMQGFERDQAQAHGDARKAWEVERAIWKARHEKVLADAKRGKADTRDLSALGPEPAAPPLPDRLVSEPTYEGLTKLFAYGQPSLGLFSDEGGQFLGGFAMSQDNRQKTLAALNSLWMGDPIKRTRQGDGAFTLYGRRLSLHLMVQPVVAHALLADPLASDTGFLPRCLMCEPASTIGTRLHDAGKWNAAPVDAFSERLADVLYTGMAMDPETRELKPRLLRLSVEAEAKLVEFSDSVERAQAPGGELELVRGHASKAAEQAARLAAVLTLWADLGTEAIAGEAMADGIALARFYLLEAARLAGVATVSVAVAKAEALRKWLLSESWGKPWVTLRDIVRNGPSRLRESPEATKAVQMLAEHGWLVLLPAGSVIEGQARKVAWRIIRP